MPTHRAIDRAHCTLLLCSHFKFHRALCVQSARREASQLIPGAMRSVDVSLTSPGPWLVQCRTANHLANGMTATIDVAPNGAHRLLRMRAHCR